jgi:hypothetical protein
MSNDSLEQWPRPYFEPGGGEPFLFYVVFGASTQGLKLSRSRYRCEGIPAGLAIQAYDQQAHPDVLDDFRSGYLWQELQDSQSALAAQVAAQRRCVVVRGALADASTLDYFRDAIGLVTCLLDNEGVAVYDPLALRWWSAREWMQDVFDPAAASPRQHVVILTSAEPGGTTWFHTRGLRKFGRPDLGMHQVPAPLHGQLVARFTDSEGAECSVGENPPAGAR